MNTDTIYCPRRLLHMSPEPGWQDDGLYLVTFSDGTAFLDDIKVKTKKGEIRVEPIGIVRHHRKYAQCVRKVHKLAREAAS